MGYNGGSSIVSAIEYVACTTFHKYVTATGGSSARPTIVAEAADGSSDCCCCLAAGCRQTSFLWHCFFVFNTYLMLLMHLICLLLSQFYHNGVTACQHIVALLPTISSTLRYDHNVSSRRSSRCFWLRTTS